MKSSNYSIFLVPIRIFGSNVMFLKFSNRIIIIPIEFINYKIHFIKHLINREILLRNFIIYKYKQYHYFQLEFLIRNGSLTNWGECRMLIKKKKVRKTLERFIPYKIKSNFFASIGIYKFYLKKNNYKIN